MRQGGLLRPFGDDAGHRNAVAMENEGHSLVAGAIDAVRELPRRLGNADGAGLHKIRLYDFMQSLAQGESKQLTHLH